MTTNIKLSDDTYWDTSSLYLDFGGRHYSFDSAKYEVQAGCVNLPDFPNNQTYAYHVSGNINFPRAFTSTPNVIICNSSTATDYRMANVSYFLNRDSVNTTRFQVRRFNTGSGKYAGTWTNQAVSYIALVPKSTQSGNNKAIRGTNVNPAKITTGTGLALDSGDSEGILWSLGAFSDGKIRNIALDDTYYTFDYGHASISPGLNANGYTKVIQFNKTFAEPPVVIACLNSDDYHLEYSRMKGQLKIATNVPGTGRFTDSTLDGRKEFVIRAWNRDSADYGTGSAGIDWIACGKAQRLGE